METRTRNEVKATVERSPSGWPSVGDVVDADDCLYVVVLRGDYIWSGGPDREDYIDVVIARISWDEVPDGVNVWPARIGAHYDRG